MNLVESFLSQFEFDGNALLFLLVMNFLFLYVIYTHFRYFRGESHRFA